MGFEIEDEEYVVEIEVVEQVNVVDLNIYFKKVFVILFINGKEVRDVLIYGDSGFIVNIVVDDVVKKLCGEDSLNNLEKIFVIFVMYNQFEV